MNTPNRREFLRSAGTVGLVTGLSKAASAASANKQLNLAVVGVRGRGRSLAGEFARLGDVNVVAVCDVDERTFDPAIKAVEQSGGKRPETARDVRRLIDRQDIDALVVATPDHWHALPTIWACQAGKDVYVEKPISHNVIEGRRMVEAARKYNRIVQVGTHRRSCPLWIDAMEKIKSGVLGKVSLVRSWTVNRHVSIKKREDTPPPPGVDYDLWLGPAPKRPFNRNRFHSYWHWFWDYGTGQLGNNGIHFMDISRWGLGLAYPNFVTSGGGQFHFDGGMETPDTQVATWDYDDVAIVWEHRMWSTRGFEDQRYGIAFYGDRATLVIDNTKWQIIVDNKVSESSPPASTPTEPHARNFVHCVKSRQRPDADIEIGHISTVLCHIGNVAHRTGRRLAFHGDAEHFVGDDEANELLGRTYRDGFELPEV